MNTLVFLLALIAALGSGLIAGVFFAFSAFVMKALDRLPADQGTAAMQSINIVVLNRWFLGAFLGTAVLAALALVASITMWQRPEAAYLLAGGALYLAGCFFVTIAFNVPRNNALAALSAQDPANAAAWSRYVLEWTRWNHVRTAASLAAALCFSLALAA